jgi:hypothetical protein
VDAGLTWPSTAESSGSRASVQRHLAGGVVLGVAHDQQRGGVVEVVLVEPDRLADTQPAHREQPDEGLVVSCV